MATEDLQPYPNIGRSLVEQIVAERDALVAERDALRAMLSAWVESTDRSEQTGSMRPVYDGAVALLAGKERRLAGAAGPRSTRSVSTKARAARKLKALRRWVEVAPHRGKMLQTIVETLFMDWESAVDQQRALRDFLAGHGCPTELISLEEWESMEDPATAPRMPLKDKSTGPYCDPEGH